MKFKLIILFAFILNIGYAQRQLSSPVADIQAITDSFPRMDASGNPKGSPVNGWVTPRIATLDATGNLTTGTTVNGIYTIKNTNNAYPSPQVGTMLHLVSDNVVNGRLSNDTYNNVSQVGAAFQGRRARGTSLIPLPPITDDILMSVGADGYGTTGYHNISLGSLVFRAKETMTDANGGTYATIATSANGTTANTVRLRIDDAGTRITGKEFIETISEGTSTDSLLVTSNGETKKIANVVAGSVVGDYSGVVQYAVGTSTNLTTVVSTNVTTSGTLLTAVNRVSLIGATVSGQLVVNAINGTIAISKNGTYSIVVTVNTQSAGLNGQWGQLVKNNATILSVSSAYNQAGGAILQTVFNYTGSFVAGDLIDVRLNANSAGTIGVTGYSYSVVQESGMLPISGSIVDYLNIVTGAIQTVTGNSTVNTAAAAVTFLTPTSQGSIPFNATTGKITLSAGKTYTLLAKVPSATTGVVFQWVNATLGTFIGERWDASTGSPGLNGNSPIVVISPTTTTDVYVQSVFAASSALGVNDVNGIRGVSVHVEQIGTTATLANTSTNVADLPTGGAIVATTVDAYVIGYNINQTTASQVLSIPNPTTTTVNRIIYINNTGSVSFQVSGFTISASQSQAFIWNGTAWSNFTNNTNQNVLSENFTNDATTNGSTTTSTTFVDVPNGTYSIPSAGTWLLKYSVGSANNTASAANSFIITDAANTQQSNSMTEQQMWTASSHLSSSSFAIVTTSGAAVYKLRWKVSGGTGTVENNTLNQTTLVGIKIGGFLPIVGNTVDYIHVVATTNQTIGLAVGSPILFNTPVTKGNITQTSGVFTLAAGKTFSLSGGIGIINVGTEVIYQWRDITNNILIGISGDAHVTASGRNMIATANITTTTATTVRLEIIFINGISDLGSTFGRQAFAEIIQIGSSGFTTLAVANGGTNNTTAYTSGSVVYSDGTKLTQDNTNLFYDATNKRLGVGTATLNATLDVSGNTWIGANRSTNDLNSLGANIGNFVSPTRTATAVVTAPETVLRLIKAGTAGVRFNASADFQVGSYATGLNAVSNLKFRLGNGASHIPDVDIMTLQGDGNVGIGTTTPTSNLTVNGSLSLPFTSTGAVNLTATAAMYTINCNNAAIAITITLPTPIGIAGRIYIIKRDAASTGVVTISPAAGLIQAFAGTFGASTTLGALGSTSKAMMFQSDGINFHLIN